MTSWFPWKAHDKVNLSVWWVFFERWCHWWMISFMASAAAVAAVFFSSVRKYVHPCLVSFVVVVVVAAMLALKMFQKLHSVAASLITLTFYPWDFFIVYFATTNFHVKENCPPPPSTTTTTPQDFGWAARYTHCVTCLFISRCLPQLGCTKSVLEIT